MHKESRGFLGALEEYADVALNLLSFFFAYVITVLIEREATIELSSPYAILIIFVNTVVLSFFYHLANFYKKHGFHKKVFAIFGTLRVNVLYFGALFLLAHFIDIRRGYEDFVYIWIAAAFVISTIFISFKRTFVLSLSGTVQRKSHKLKRIIIVGDNTHTAKDYVKEIESNPDYGAVILGYVGDKIDDTVGIEKLGSFKDFAEILDKFHPTDVVFAIESYDKWRLIKLVNMCDDRCIKVYFLPVIYGFFKNPKQIETLGSVPLINIHSTPLDNLANATIKRIVDIIGSLALIVLTAPIMIAAAIGVYISSPGPIFFKQKRVGKLGKKFTMLKFRSMRVNSASNDAWSTGEDERKTRFGTFLRKTAIDELPQLFNVLAGSMSLVGPRPELPVFVEKFKEEIPLYMVKHYAKPGVTGLAQVKGLRGDTSISERIQEDITYIENWSLWLDISILLKTPFKAFNKEEKYAGGKVNQAPEETPSDNKLIRAPREEPQEEEKRGKKILYVASTINHINSFHLDYIDALRKMGNEVKVMARGLGADFNVPFEKKFFSKKNSYARKKIREIVLAEGFDVILTNTTLAAFHVRLAVSLRCRPRIVNMVHGYLFSENTNFLKRIPLLLCEKLVKRKTDAIIVMNKEDRRIAKRHHLTSGRVYFCHGLGVKEREFNKTPQEVRAELNSENNYNLLFVGELSARKNQKYLISYMPKLKEFIPHIRLWLVGDGDEREKLSAFAKKLGVENDVLFLGRKENVGDYINAADIYVSASKSEGLPFNIVEAMSLGKPTLASRCKGQEDIIANWRSGFLYELDRSDDFIRDVKLIHDGVYKLEKEAITARASEYSFDNVFEETLRVMTEAFDEKNNTRSFK